MKRIDFYYFFTLALLACIFCATCGVPKINHVHGRPSRPAITRPEQLTSHFLELEDKDEEILGVCTGTAIGPHAILTASHCNERDKVKNIKIDLSPETHTVLASAGDGRDHEILLIDGSPFKNIEVVHQATPNLNEVATLYGVGGTEYPPNAKHGHVTGCDDPSDVDADAGITCYSIHVIPGDSGSTIYNDYGEIIGITTYRDDATYPSSMVGFTLNFTQKILDDAAHFDGKNTPKPVGESKP